VDCFPGEKNKEFLSRAADAYCDIVCHGESEISFREYLHHFLATGNWKTTVPGFAYYDGDQLVDTGPAELPTLKEKLPTPPLEMFDLSKYTHKGSLPFFFTRGCPFSCQFCSETVNYRSFRFRKAEEAFGELQQILPHAQQHAEVPTLRFSDSIFNAHVRELEKFIDLILEHKIQVRMGGQGHILSQMTTPYLRKLADAGFLSIFWGIESGSQQVVDLMKKAYKVSDARRIIDDCSKLGIRQDIPILIGFPGETPEDVVETAEFMLEYQVKPFIHFHQPAHVIVRKNTPLKLNPAHFGLQTTEDYEWATADGTNTLPIRIARRFILRQVHGNPELSMERLVDTEEIKAIALNASNVAEDLFRMLYALLARGNSAQSLGELFGERRPDGRPAGEELGKEEALARWMQLDKDSAEGRERVYRLVLDCLRTLREAIRSREPRLA